jgi:glycosyltransferase involved in cell wall biosynthesis
MTPNARGYFGPFGGQFVPETLIPALNEQHYIGDILRDLQLQTHPPDEVIVVDGGSSDDTLQVIRQFPSVRVMTAQPPVGRQRMAGGLAASGDVLLFLDADTQIEPAFIEQLLARMQRQRLDILCPCYCPIRSTPPVAAVYWSINLLMALFQSVAPSGAGSCIAVRRRLFMDAGGFDASLTHDDIAFIRRAARRGRFRFTFHRVYVSDRRFKQFGFWRTVTQYAVLSTLFLLGLFRVANFVPYGFCTANGQHQRSDEERIEH